MEPFIEICRHPYEEPYHVHLVVTVSNGRQQAELEIYDSATIFSELAAKLRRFPDGQEDQVLWELGSELPEDRFAFYFRMRFYQLLATGKCAIELRFNNNEKGHRREIAEFSLAAVPADLDRLADLLEQFGKLEHLKLLWNLSDGNCS